MVHLNNGAPKKGEIMRTPPEGLGHWGGALLVSTLGVPSWRVWEILRIEGICLARRCLSRVSQDPDFAAKAPDVVALCLAPPKNAIVPCVDEKPSLQAITRPAGCDPACNKLSARP